MPAHRSGPQRVHEGEAETKVPSVPYDVFFSSQAITVYKSLHQKMADAENRGESCSSYLLGRVF